MHRRHDHRLQYESNFRTTLRARFTGSIPNEIGALVALTYLDLSVTSIEGTLNIKEMKLPVKPAHHAVHAGLHSLQIEW